MSLFSNCFNHQLLKTFTSEFDLVRRKSVAMAWRDRWACMLGAAVQDAIASSLLAQSGIQLVLDQSASHIPELDVVLDGQKWAVEHSDLPAFD